MFLTFEPRTHQGTSGRPCMSCCATLMSPPKSASSWPYWICSRISPSTPLTATLCGSESAWPTGGSVWVSLVFSLCHSVLMTFSYLLCVCVCVCVSVVCRCLKFLGERHPTLVLPLVPELLSTHPYFDTPEPDMDDPACILPAQHCCIPLFC